MKLSKKAAQDLRRQIKTTLRAEGFDGKFGDIDAVWEFVESEGLELKAAGESIEKKMLMNILGGTIELEPAEGAVEGDAMDEEEPKAMEEDEEIDWSALPSVAGEEPLRLAPAEDAR